MPRTDFTSLPDDARLWIFGAERPLSPEEREALLARADAFLDGWAAHGAPVVGARELREDRFLLVGADERTTGVSGCSIDTLFHALGDLESRLGVSLRDPGMVFWRDGTERVRADARPAFRARVRAGEIGGDTPVFDGTVDTVGALRAGRWERPARESWHRRAFGIEA
jgi:hypothetical protein